MLTESIRAPARAGPFLGRGYTQNEHNRPGPRPDDASVRAAADVAGAAFAAARAAAGLARAARQPRAGLRPHAPRRAAGGWALHALRRRIAEWKRRRNAVVLAHTTDPEIFHASPTSPATRWPWRSRAPTDADVIVLCGVTSWPNGKGLSPEKTCSSPTRAPAARWPNRSPAPTSAAQGALSSVPVCQPTSNTSADVKRSRLCLHVGERGGGRRVVGRRARIFCPTNTSQVRRFADLRAAHPLKGTARCTTVHRRGAAPLPRGRPDAARPRPSRVPADVLAEPITWADGRHDPPPRLSGRRAVVMVPSARMSNVADSHRRSSSCGRANLFPHRRHHPREGAARAADDGSTNGGVTRRLPSRHARRWSGCSPSGGVAVDGRPASDRPLRQGPVVAGARRRCRSSRCDRRRCGVAASPPRSRCGRRTTAGSRACSSCRSGASARAERALGQGGVAAAMAADDSPWRHAADT